MIITIQAPYTKRDTDDIHIYTLKSRGVQWENGMLFLDFPLDHIVGEDKDGKKHAIATIPLENTFSRKPLQHSHNYTNGIP